MARRPPSGREGRPARRTTGDPYGLTAARPFLAPILSLGGLAIVGLLTLALLTGNLPFITALNPDGGPNDPGSGGAVVPGRTPSPSAPPVVNPEVGIDGKLVYAKAGNLWIHEGTESRRLTNTGRDAQPAWSADGAWVYFIETRTTTGRFAVAGFERYYDLRYPILTRIRPDGSDREALLSGLYRTGPSNRFTWFFFLRDPAVSPDGKQLALVSDGPDPTTSNVVLQTFDDRPHAPGEGGRARAGAARPPEPDLEPRREVHPVRQERPRGRPGAADALAVRGGDEEVRSRSPDPATPTPRTPPTGAGSSPRRPRAWARTSSCSTPEECGSCRRSLGSSPRPSHSRR